VPIPTELEVALASMWLHCASPEESACAYGDCGSQGRYLVAGRLFCHLHHGIPSEKALFYVPNWRKQAFPDVVRRALFDEWGGRCVMCGAPATCIDHIFPKVHGGIGAHANGQPMCSSCNSRKGARIPPVGVFGPGHLWAGWDR
jgi:hypothetical protein